MRPDDEQDPLDRWLSQQVTPLPPPEGTFELISRRARRRRARRIAVVAASAATAAAAAVAVPAGLALSLALTPAGGPLAGQSATPATRGTRAQAHTQTQTPYGSATPDATPHAAITTHPATEPSGPVPANFAPTSVTFVSTSLGWVIGQAGTPGTCADANPDICTSVARTDNAGKTWEGGPAPKTTAPNGPTGVSAVRFLDGVNGWAFGPGLWTTHDAGNVWTQVNTAGQRVTDLETAGNRVYALWAQCTGASSYFADNCTSYTLMTTTAGSDLWTPLGGATNGLTAQGAATSGMIALTGTRGYLVAPDGTLYSGPLDGSAWQRAGTVPCQPGRAQASGLPSFSQFAATDSGHLAFACASRTVTGTPAVYTSGNGGASWTPLPAGSWPGIHDPGQLTSLTAAPSGTLVLATRQGLYVLPAGTSSWRRTNATGTQAPSGGFSYVGMTTSEQGVAVPADTALHEIWMTFNGGQTWAPATPITPGN